jgi:ABC-type antimicrobial peptide transport system permease subunit
VGGAIGIVVGFLISTLQKTLGILKISSDSDIPYPISFKIEDALLVFTTMMVLGLVTSIYPWVKAYSIAQNNLKIYK